jgi:hypothetical protein
VVGVVAVVCIAGLPIVAYIVVKSLAHNERMEMIRMGYFSGGYPSAQPAPARPSAANIIVLPPLRTAGPDATISPLRTVLEANRRES